MLSNSLIIFDLSGTLTVERDGPPNTPGDVVLVDGARDVVRWLENSGAQVYVASNQGGVAYGYLDIDTCDKIMARSCKVQAVFLNKRQPAPADGALHPAKIDFHLPEAFFKNPVHLSNNMAPPRREGQGRGPQDEKFNVPFSTSLPEA